MDSWINQNYKWKMRLLNGEDNCLKNQQYCVNTAESRTSSIIGEMSETKKHALLAQLDTQSAAQEERNRAVLRRHKIAPLQQTSGPERTPGSSDPERGPKLTPLKEKGVKSSWISRGHLRSLDANDSDEDEWRRTYDWSYNRLDNHTPFQLRALPYIRTPVSPPPSPPSAPQSITQPNSRACRLPVMTTKLLGETKRVSGGYHLRTFTGQVEALQSALLNFHPDTGLRAPRPPAAPRGNGVSKPVTSALPKKTSEKHLRPAPPPKPSPPKEKKPSVTSRQPAPPPTPAPEKIPGTKQRRSVHPVQAAHPGQAVGVAKKPASCKPPTAENIELEDLRPLSSPEESLNLLFELLNSGNWEKKIKGLEIVQALAQHHTDTLKSKLVDVCYAVVEEVKNLRSCVATVAINTMVYLHVYLQRSMDNMADLTGSALLQKIAQSTANAFLRQQATKALDCLVQNCSPGQVLNVLLRTGLSHLCVAVRVSTAEKIHLLASDLGAPAILKTAKGFSKTFLTAISRMCVDASSEVRPHGIAILEDLAFLPNFKPLWDSIIPPKDRAHLDKLLKKIRE